MNNVAWKTLLTEELKLSVNETYYETEKRLKAYTQQIEVLEAKVRAVKTIMGREEKD